MTRQDTVGTADLDTFGATGVVAHFAGPYAGGPPEDALAVHVPPIGSFGFGELRRMVAISTVLVLMVARAVALWTLRRRRPPAAAAADGLVDAFVALGPTFVKLGQVIASSPGLFPAPLSDACLRCMDEVPPFPASTARRLVEEDLGRSPSQLFRRFDDTPLSAASIAQVHACELPDGRQAVIKLQRPAIAQGMNTDLRIMHRLARLAERTEPGRRMNLAAAILDLHQVTNQELNFALEAHRQAYFREHLGAFGDNGWTTAPEVYWDYCGPHMICMERMYGVPIDDFEALEARDVDGELVLRRGIKAWLEAALVHGPFHGDVHAGNIWVLDDGRATFLDFGIMGELSGEWKQVLRDLFYTSMIDGDYTRVVRNYKRVGVLPEDIGSDKEVGATLKLAVEPMLDQGVGSVSLGETFKSNLELAQQYGAQAPQELMLISKQVLYFERYVTQLAPGYVMARDLFLVKNLFPDDVARQAAELGVELPADPEPPGPATGGPPPR
jgi:predicted unusual protein kinase regulating ubiquinone biosynthesis (AarF/ABC1/UbiB family)